MFSIMCRPFSPWEHVGRVCVLRVGLGWGNSHQRFRETGSASGLFSGDADVESISGLESTVTEFCVFASTTKLSLSYKFLMGLIWRHGTAWDNGDKNTNLSGSLND